MKKYFPGIIALIIALFCFAFTTKKSNTAANLVYFEVSNVTTNWSSSTLIYPATQPAAMPSDPFGCTGSNHCCAEGYAASDIFQDTDGKWKPVNRSLWQARDKKP